MEEDKRRCHSCLYYRPYFTQGWTQYDKLSYGLCVQSGERQQDRHGTCEKWRLQYRRKLLRRTMACIALTRAADSINVIKELLSEDEKEEGNL